MTENQLLIRAAATACVFVVWALKAAFGTKQFPPRSAPIVPAKRLEYAPVVQSTSRTPIVAVAEEFDRRMSSLAEEQGAEWLHSRIAGVSHRNSNGTSRQAKVELLNPNEELKLEQDLNNKFSHWAVKVLDQDGNQLGFIPDDLARRVNEALQSGGYAACFVQSVGQSGRDMWGASIAVLWRVKLSPRNEFRRSLDRRQDLEEWFWAKISRRTDGALQDCLRNLMPNERLTLNGDCASLQSSSKLYICNSQDERLAVLTKQQALSMLAALATGARFEVRLFEVCARGDGQGLEPVAAILRLRH